MPSRCRVNSGASSWKAGNRRQRRLILGVILGDQIEINLVRAVMTDSDPWLFLTRPISGTMLALSALSVALALWQHRRAQARMAPPEEPEVEF